MRIKTQFILAMVLFVAVLAATFASAMLTSYRVEQVGRQERRAQDVAQGASELNYLANDYLVYRESQQLERWQARFSRFAEEVNALEADRWDQQTLVRDIQSNARRLNEVFQSVVATVGQPAPQSPDSVSVALLQVSRSRIGVQVQGLTASATRLAQLLGREGDRLQRTNAYIIVALVGVSVAYLLVNYGLIQRRMLRSVATLQAGTQVIGSGDLDFRIEETTDDEIGDLTHAFNRMAAELKTATDAVLVERQRLVKLNETLEHRVSERTVALRESEEELRAVFDAIGNGVVVYDAGGTAVRANPSAIALLGADPTKQGREGILGSLKICAADGRPLAFGELVSSRALRGEPVAAESLVYTHPDGHKLHILATGTPLFDRDRVAGAVVVWQDITERQALEEALRAQARERAVFEERQNMARDLHDVVSQTLFSASLTADVLPKLYARDPVHGQKLLDELRRMNRGALAEMRTLLAELRPQALLDLDLALLLQQLAEAAAGRSSTVVTVRADKLGPLPPDVQVALYRIAQEALHNVAKHSHAQQATVCLQRERDPAPRIVLSVEDDGCGFDPVALPANTFGLTIMSERADAIGASLSIDSRPGAGTRVGLIWIEQPAPTGSA